MRALGLCWGTVPRASLLAHIDAAVEAGYTTISVSPEQYAGAQRSPTELRSRLNDSGICVEAVDPALTWLPGLPATPDAGLLSSAVAELLDAAAALSAPWINAEIGRASGWERV